MSYDLVEFRAWLEVRHRTDYGASEDQMRAVLDQARAKRRALGYGSVHVMAANLLRESALPERKDA